MPRCSTTCSPATTRCCRASAWAPLRSPADLTTRVTRALVPAMARHGVRRLVAVSAGGVGESLDRCSWAVRRMVATANLGVAYRDLAAMEATLAASDLDWCVVRPVTLVDGEPTGRARPVERYGLFSVVRRADVAAFMLAAAESPSLGSRAVMVGSG
ncbi:NAD(P)-dependent oxidoreductase [Gemmatirosa kalamazoonensis]